MIYELHDEDTATMIDAGSSERALLDTVAAYVTAHGYGAALSWVLLRADDAGRSHEVIALGDDLIERALRQTAGAAD